MYYVLIVEGCSLCENWPRSATIRAYDWIIYFCSQSVLRYVIQHLIGFYHYYDTDNTDIDGKFLTSCSWSIHNGEIQITKDCHDHRWPWKAGKFTITRITINIVSVSCWCLDWGWCDQISILTSMYDSLMPLLCSIDNLFSTTTATILNVIYALAS